MYKDAEISDCGLYRYCLWREWSPGRAVTFIMLNPSTADDKEDDPTIRKCLGFAKRWGYDKLVVVNVCAYRATDPTELGSLLTRRVIGPENSKWIEFGAIYGDLIVPAWGVRKPFLDRAYLRAEKIIKKVNEKFGTPVECLELLKDFSPKHPLYASYDQPRIPYLIGEAQ